MQSGTLLDKINRYRQALSFLRCLFCTVAGSSGIIKLFAHDTCGCYQHEQVYCLSHLFNCCHVEILVKILFVIILVCTGPVVFIHS
jgi:hypothetical protein